MRRQRKTKIVATVGPASSTAETLRQLFDAGVDVFRLNFSHGNHADHLDRINAIRAVENETKRPIGILADLQGPKLRIGRFASGSVQLARGEHFVLDLNQDEPGDRNRISLPHPELFSVLKPGLQILLDDGKIQLEVEEATGTRAVTRVTAGGTLSDRKGVNLPGAILPLSAITEKDRKDLEFAVEHGADWIALSFVQRADDIREVRGLAGPDVKIVAKLEKPAAISDLESIIAEADAIMVARGDLGVEMPPELVPAIQKRIVRACRRAGKPVIVATQMLESMINAPTPTRAEASDVATAVYDGADAVMLSAESASGSYPVEAVTMMDRIISRTEADPYHHDVLDASHTEPDATMASAIGLAARGVSELLHASALVAYTSSGFSAIRMSRERCATPVVGMTPSQRTARLLALVWGVHAVVVHEVDSVSEMTDYACDIAQESGYAQSGDTVVISAGLPFREPGTTNLLRIARVP
ncbi:pyruvate kinase [Bordetella sp. N]|uniref:pyruvate kinase n=1 Tax=Bordetella sp. N TaxID=1746199 RepID=UPI0007101002|nr:pyruvate kinase [Bordetella sp. N]ALM84212.1 pyruvate kinase [Bordetella sp. N]